MPSIKESLSALLEPILPYAGEKAWKDLLNIIDGEKRFKSGLRLLATAGGFALSVGLVLKNVVNFTPLLGLAEESTLKVAFVFLITTSFSVATKHAIRAWMHFKKTGNLDPRDYLIIRAQEGKHKGQAVQFTNSRYLISKTELLTFSDIFHEEFGAKLRITKDNASTLVETFLPKMILQILEKTEHRDAAKEALERLREGRADLFYALYLKLTVYADIDRELVLEHLHGKELQSVSCPPLEEDKQTSDGLSPRVGSMVTEQASSLSARKVKKHRAKQFGLKSSKPKSTYLRMIQNEQRCQEFLSTVEEEQKEALQTLPPNSIVNVYLQTRSSIQRETAPSLEASTSTTSTTLTPH